MRNFKISKLLVGAAAALCLSVLSAHASDTVIEGSAMYGSGGSGSGVVAAAKAIDHESAVLGKIRVGKLSSNVSILTAEVDALLKLTPNIGVYAGVGVLSHDEALPIFTGGVVLQIEKFNAYLDSYLANANNCGVKTTIPVYSYNIDDQQQLTLSVYGEINRALIKTERTETVGTSDPHVFDTITIEDEKTKIMRNAGVQVSFCF